VMSNREQSLRDALVDYRHRMQYRTADLPCQLHWRFELADCPPLAERIILQLLRIVQEAVTNAIKHADAHDIEVSAAISPGLQLTLSVADDGRGLPDIIKNGRGLNNMRKRAQLVGASLAIENRAPPATGAQVRLTLDLSDGTAGS
jgi:signal transduction histidine kinase